MKGAFRMKVLITRNNPSKYFPSSVPPTLVQGKDYPYNRMNDVIRHMEELAHGNVILLKDYTDNYIKSNPNKVFTIQGGEDYMYTWNPVDCCVSTYVIKNIFPQVAWLICSDKNGEYIKELSPDDDYEIIDQTLNYAKCPRKRCK